MSATTHPIPDGDLIRYLDEECDAREQEGLTAHVTTCVACAARLASLRAADRKVGLALDLGIPDIPDLDQLRPSPGIAPSTAPARRPWRMVIVPLAIAAGLVLVLSPLGALLIDLLHGARPIEPAANPAAMPFKAESGDGSSKVSFVPSTLELRIVVRSRQAAGDLVLQITGDSTVRVAITAVQAAEEIVVLPGTVEIVNTERSTSSYAVDVPAALRRVILSIGNGSDSVLWSGPAPGATTFRFSLRGLQD